MNTNRSFPITVRWIPGKTYAEIHGLHPQTLANWRREDKLSGRSEARPGFPPYRRFGKAVRYLLPPEAMA